MENIVLLSIVGSLVFVFILACLFSPNTDPSTKPKKKVKSESNEASQSTSSSTEGAHTGDDAPPTKAEMNKISKNLKEAMKRLKTEYPPDPRLIVTLRGLIFSGDIRKLYDVAKSGFIDIASQLARQLIKDAKTSSSTDYINLLATIGGICTMDDQDFKLQAANSALLKSLSKAYELYKKDEYFRPKDKERFVGTATMLLSGITVADDPVKPILKTPNLFKLGKKAIYMPNAAMTAVLFYMNVSYEAYGRELLRKCKPKFFEALIDFLAAAPPSVPMVFQQVYLTLSNMYLHSPHDFRQQFTKILVDHGFTKILARDIRRLQLDAIGLTMNIFQEGHLYDGALAYEVIEAIADAANNKKCGRENMEHIGDILYNLVTAKKAPQALAECNAQEPLQRLAECPNKEVAEYAEVLLTKLNVVTGEISAVERKCSNPNCSVRSEKLKKCSQCSSVWYCSKECQVNDWPNHKQVCVQLKEKDTQVPKKQGNQDRTVAMKFLHEHVADFEMLARKQHLGLDACVIVVDFTQPVRKKTTAYSIEKFFNDVLKKPPFSTSGGDIDMPRLRQSHANCGQPAFIGVVIQVTSISTFVIPLVFQTRQSN